MKSKRTMIVLIALILTFANSTAIATANGNNMHSADTESIISSFGQMEDGVYDEEGNWYNPETGEYFRLISTTGSSRSSSSYTYSYYFKRTVNVGLFCATNTTGTVTTDMHYEDANGNIISVASWTKTMSVGLRGNTSGTLAWGYSMPCPSTYAKNFSGTSAGTYYYVKLYNDSYYDLYYCVGTVRVDFSN